jgi:general secretion pathway protein D
MACFLASCASRLQLGDIGHGDSVDPARIRDFMAHYPAHNGDQATTTGAAPEPRVFPGTESTPTADTRWTGRTTSASLSDISSMGGEDSTGNQGVEINFDNADIQTVAKSIVSDTLGLNVAVDPRVQGNVTIASSAAVPRKNLLATFESVMRLSNAAVIREGNLVKVVPLPEASGSGHLTLQPGVAGFGVTVIPLRYVTSTAVAKMAENFLARPGALRADAQQNLILVQGTAAERQNAVNLITSFDVEWLRNQSVGIFPLKSTSPETMIRELGRVFESGKDGRGAGLISFQPIARMNAVMAVARNRKFIDQAALWIRRLDHSDTSGTTIRVYRLERGDAQKIAKILNTIFVGRSGVTETATSQLAPGTTGALSKLDSVGTSGSSSNASSSSSISSASNSKTASSFDNFADASDKEKKTTAEDSSASGAPSGLFQNVRITADTSNNSIVIFSNQEDYKLIERSLRELDRPQLQVEIEATIAEVTLTDSLQYGVQYYLGSTAVGAGLNNGSISLSTSSSSATPSQTLPGLNVVLGTPGGAEAVLNALSSLTTVKVLSAPTLVVADNQPAYLQVGDSVPISTGSATVLSSTNTIVNTTTYQDTGIILKVWPHVHIDGVVDLEIQQEVSDVVGGTSSSTTNLNPTISERRIHSTVSVASGQTVLLGGLMSEETDKTQTGVPILRQIQVLGDLFGSTTKSKTRTEIIVFVKPHVIRDGFDAQNVAEAFRDGLRTMHSDISIVSGRDIHAYGGRPPILK